MSSFRGYFSAPRASLLSDAAQVTASHRSLLELSSALVYGLQRLDGDLDLSGHASRVIELADGLARRHGVAPELRASLRHAALLHEIGLIGLPRVLLTQEEPLTFAEVELVRSQSRFSAAMARAAGDELAATIIEHQYVEDEAGLRAALGEEGETLRLVAFLRAADVADAVARGGMKYGAAHRALHDRRRGLHPTVLPGWLGLESSAA